MKTPTTHVYLVSAQATPNVTPALDPKMRPKKVILIVSQDMQQQAEWLKSVLKEGTAAQVDIWTIQDAWDMEHIRTRIMELLEHYDDANIILNATGGTKLMSIAAFDAFRAWEKEIFYIHPQKDELIWLNPRERKAHPLADHVKLRHFLMAHGSQEQKRGTSSVPPVYRELTDFLITHVQHFGTAIRSLNYYAYTAERNLRSAELNPRDWRNPILSELIERFSKAGILKPQGKSLVFPNEAARFFANGGWLEQHVYAQLIRLRKQKANSKSTIQDLAQSLEVSRLTQRGQIKNELDVALLANNRLFIIECKTKFFERYNHEDGPGAEALYKLDTLKETLGGLRGKGMLVSYLALSRADRRRAEDLKIAVCDGERLQQLASALDKWVR